MILFQRSIEKHYSIFSARQAKSEYCCFVDLPANQYQMEKPYGHWKNVIENLERGDAMKLPYRCVEVMGYNTFFISWPVQAGAFAFPSPAWFVPATDKTPVSDSCTSSGKAHA